MDLGPFELSRHRRIATISPSSRFVVDGVFRQSGVVHSFKVVDPVLFVFGSHVFYNNTGFGKINSVNFKVNNKKTIRDTKLLYLDSETTKLEVLNHIVLKRISCKWWPLFARCLRAERLGDCKTDRLTASTFSGVREVRGRPHLFSDTLPVSLKFSTHNRIDFRSGTRSRGGIW